MSFSMKYEENKAHILDYCPFLTDEIYLECQQSSKTKFNKLLTFSLKCCKIEYKYQIYLTHDVT